MRTAILLSLLLLNLFSVCIISQQKYYSFSGRIMFASDSSDLVGANIVLRNTALGASTNIQSKFVINNIPEGKYIVRVSYVGLTPKMDTVLFSGNNLSFVKDYRIGFMVIKPSQINEIRKYYDSLKLSAGSKKIISIIMDSLSLENDSITVYSTFVNNTNCPVYIASPYKYKPAITFQIKTADSIEISKIQTFYYDYDVSEDDVTVLPPKGQYKYILWKEPLPYNFIHSLDSIFTIGIKYKAEPKNIHIPYVDNMTMDDCLSNIAKFESKVQWRLPGEIISDNSLMFKRH
jgi:hypothetical protein